MIPGFSWQHDLPQRTQQTGKMDRGREGNLCVSGSTGLTKVGGRVAGVGMSREESRLLRAAWRTPEHSLGRKDGWVGKLTYMFRITRSDEGGHRVGGGNGGPPGIGETAQGSLAWSRGSREQGRWAGERKVAFSTSLTSKRMSF